MSYLEMGDEDGNRDGDSEEEREKGDREGRPYNT